MISFMLLGQGGPTFGPAGSFGVAGAGLAIAFVAMQIISKWLDAKGFTSRKETGEVKCPNHIQDLAQTLRNIDSWVKVMRDNETKILTGVSTLVRQHAAGPDGVERFKITERLEGVIETTADHQKEIIAQQRQIVERLTELVTITRNGARSK